MGEEITEDQIESTHQRLHKDAGAGGYNLNPDTDFTRELVWGLITNEKRYGYMACPCRIASGTREEDLDIICPCDYRDLDLEEYDACYCALYVSRDITDGKKEPEPIPERRPTAEEREMLKKGNDQSWDVDNKDSKDTRAIEDDEDSISAPPKNLAYPVWRCKVCGYLCARESPPGICPVCKASKDRFERFM